MRSREARDAIERLGSYFRPADAQEAGVSHDALGRLVCAGHVERAGWGLYRRLDLEPTENHSLAAACARVPVSIVCPLSALQVHGIGTRLPAQVWLAVPNKARAPRVPGVTLRIVRFSGAAWTYGVQDTDFEGVAARITSPARTVIDCFRRPRRVSAEAAKEALYDSLRERIVRVDELYRAMEILPSTRLHAALEAMP